MFVHELDDVERVENDLGLRKILGDGGGVGPRHVHGDGLDAGAGPSKASPEGLKGFAVTALADIDDSPGVEIKNDGAVFELSPEINFIDGDFLERLERRFPELALQALFVHFLDDVPVISDMVGDVL